MSTDKKDILYLDENALKIDKNTEEKNPIFVLAKINKILKEETIKNNQ